MFSPPNKKLNLKLLVNNFINSDKKAYAFLFDNYWAVDSDARKIFDWAKEKAVKSKKNTDKYFGYMCLRFNFMVFVC